MIESKLRTLLGDKALYCLFLITELLLAATGIAGVVSLFIFLSLFPTVLPFLLHGKYSEYPLLLFLNWMLSTSLTCIPIFTAEIVCQRVLFSKKTIERFKTGSRHE